MRIAYFDCFAGLSGEMMLGALLAAGLSIDDLRATLAHLPIAGHTLKAQTVVRKELSGTHVTIAAPRSQYTNGHAHNGNGHADTSEQAPTSAVCIIEKSNLPDIIKRTSLAIFRRLSQAETAVFPRWTDVNSHPQEADAILTVVGVVAGLSLLKIDRVECSPLHVGSGVARTASGVQPALSPITLEILRASGVPVYGSDVDNELVSPIGAAIVTTLASTFGPLPAMKIAAVGYGAGSCDLPQTPNVVCLLIGETASRAVATPDIPRAETETQTSPPEPIEAAETTPPTSQPFIATQDDWVTFAIKGHQQSGRQRS